MANKILLKKSGVAGRVPATSVLEHGELAINYKDGYLYYKNGDSTPAIEKFVTSDLITLDLATDNGATTTNSITVGGLSIGSAYSLPAQDGSNGQVLTTDGSGNLSFTTASTVSSIDDLSDVDTTTTSPSSGQVLKWNGSNWTPANDIDTTLSLGSASINDLGDVNISSASDGQVLKYDSATSKWVNSADAGGISLTDLSIGTDGTASGSGSLAYNNSTGVFTYTPPDLSSYITASSTDTLTNKSGNISQWTNDSGYLTSYTETNDLTSAVTWANVPDANITESSVTQHQAALSITESQITDLQNYITDITGENLGDLSNVTLTSPTSGQVLQYNGTAWVNATNSGGGIALTDLSVTTNSAGTAALAYNNSTGVFTYTPPDLSSYLTSETTTSLTYNSSTTVLSFTDENGSTTNIDLSGLLDEDARAIASGTLNGTTGIVTFTRDDSTTFTVDLSDLLDDTNLVTSVNGAAGVVVLDTDDINEGSTNLYYTDARVDTHLNQNNPTSGYVLSWNGTDYAWVAQSGGGIALTDLSVGTEGTPSGDGSISYNNTTGVFTYTPPDLSGYLTSYTETQTLDDVITLGSTTTQTAVIPFYYAQQSNFPSATTYHGAMAHSHSDGAMYFAHGGSWVELANSSDVPTALTDLSIVDGTNGQVLTTDGNGNFSFASVSSGATALNGLSDVTLTTPSSGQLLSYNGSQWVNTTPAYLDNTDIGSNVLAYDSNLQSFVTTFTLPTSDGSANQVLTTDGNGTLSFSTVSGGSGSLTVSEISGSTTSNEVTSVTALRFDNTTGFNVTDLGSGEVEISLGSSFKTLQVSGQSDLVAVGEDTLELIAGTGISITTNTSSTPKALTITATGSSVAQVLNNGDFSDNTSAVELTTTTANQTLDSFATADYRTAKYLVQAINGADVHSTEVFLTHDDNDVYITEYATIYTNTSLFTISAEISGTNLNVIVTPTSANTTFDFVRTLIVARTVQSFEFEGDLQSLGGSATDLQSETGDAVDLNDIGLEGDLQSSTGSEDLNSGSGGTDLSS